MNKPIRYFNWATYIAIGIAILTILKYYTTWRWIPFNDWTAFAGFCGISMAIYGIQYLESKRIIESLLKNPDIDIEPIFDFFKKVDYNMFLECVAQYNRNFLKVKESRILILSMLLNTSLSNAFDPEEKAALKKIIGESSQERNLVKFKKIIQNMEK